MFVWSFKAVHLCDILSFEVQRESTWALASWQPRRHSFDVLCSWWLADRADFSVIEVCLVADGWSDWKIWVSRAQSCNEKTVHHIGKRQAGKVKVGETNSRQVFDAFDKAPILQPIKDTMVKAKVTDHLGRGSWESPGRPRPRWCIFRFILLIRVSWS